MFTPAPPLDLPSVLDRSKPLPAPAVGVFGTAPPAAALLLPVLVVPGLAPAARGVDDVTDDDDDGVSDLFLPAAPARGV